MVRTHKNRQGGYFSKVTSLSRSGTVLILQIRKLLESDTLEREFSMKKWEDLAEWWDNKQGDDGDLWHRTLIDPAVLHVLGNVSGKDVLDLGCGNGYFFLTCSRGDERRSRP